MGMTIDELITFCEEMEYNHRLNCKRYDDASGYTRSKDKNIRTACAIREETYADFYKEIADTMRKYQKIESKIKVLGHFTEDTPLATQRMIRIVNEIIEVIENGNDD